MRPKPLPDLWPEVREEAAFSKGAEACPVVVGALGRRGAQSSAALSR